MSDSVTGRELAASELLGVLPAEALDDLAKRAKIRNYEAGQVLFNEGDTGDSLHVCRKGSVRIVRIKMEGKEPYNLETINPGEAFGELAVLDPAPRSATAIALDACETVEVWGRDLEAVLDGRPQLSRRMLGTLARSLTEAKEELAAQNNVLDRRVREKTRQLRETQLEVIRRLGRAAEFRDDDTGLHISRMSHLCVRLAQAAGLDQEACDLILHAAPMHDIGKIGIPDRVLLKPGKLDDEEWEIMKSHTLIGAELLSGSESPVMQLAQVIALNHHEKWDGRGYPNGIKEEEIPLEARIATVCDVFDALISERPYKKAWAVEDAKALIKEQAGRDFDPRLAGLFIDLGSEVEGILEIWAQKYRDAEKDLPASIESSF